MEDVNYVKITSEEYRNLIEEVTEHRLKRSELNVVEARFRAAIKENEMLHKWLAGESYHRDCYEEWLKVQTNVE